MASKVVIPADEDNVTLTVAGCDVRLTNLRKLFWPERGVTKGALIQYYADVSGLLLPHIRDRAMVMKRYPHGADGPFFFMKRAPVPRPAWIRTCTIDHTSGNIIDFPVIDDVPSLLWVINLGCIDYNQNASGRTLASIYSVRPRPLASVSTPITWDEVASGVTIEDFTLENVRTRFEKTGDLWKPLLAARGRTNLETFLAPRTRP